jgi:hypothetical protein
VEGVAAAAAFAFVFVVVDVHIHRVNAISVIHRTTAALSFVVVVREAHSQAPQFWESEESSNEKVTQSNLRRDHQCADLKSVFFMARPGPARTSRQSGVMWRAALDSVAAFWHRQKS